MIVYYVKADQQKRRPVGTIIKMNQKKFEEEEARGFVKEFKGEFPPKKGYKIKFNLKDLK